MDKTAIEQVFAKARRMYEAPARKLLVVEDDARQRHTIRELVGNGTAELIDAENGSQALGFLKEHEFDCVVLDLMLPDMSGFDLIEQVRSQHPRHVARREVPRGDHRQPLVGFPSLDRRGPGMDRDLTGRADRQSRLKAPLQLHALRGRKFF